MTDADYQNRAEALLKAVELNVDRINDETDLDIDAQRTGGMVTLTLPDRSQIIVNMQKPLHEIWMAAKSGGYHYQWRVDAAGAGAWRENRGGSEFFADLTRDACSQAAFGVVFDGI